MQGNQLTRLSHYINTESPCDKKSLPTDLHELWNHRETLCIESRITVMMDIIMSTICMILMSEHSSDSISNRLAQLGKNTLQKKHTTRLEDHNNIDQPCDGENLLTDLPESWPYKEPLHNRSRLINYRNCIIKVMYQYMQKEVYILSRPLKLQPMANYSIASPLQLVTQCTPREKDLPQPLSTLGAQEMYQYAHKELYILQEPSEGKRNHPLWAKRFAREPLQVKQTLVQHRQNTSW